MELSKTSKISDNFKLRGNILMSVFASPPLICIVNNKLLDRVVL